MRVDAAGVTVDAVHAVTMIPIHRALRRIDRNLRVVHTEAVPLRVRKREQARLQHLSAAVDPNKSVWREFTGSGWHLSVSRGRTARTLYRALARAPAA